MAELEKTSNAEISIISSNIMPALKVDSLSVDRVSKRKTGNILYTGKAAIVNIRIELGVP